MNVLSAPDARHVLSTCYDGTAYVLEGVHSIAVEVMCVCGFIINKFRRVAPDSPRNDGQVCVAMLLCHSCAKFPSHAAADSVCTQCRLAILKLDGKATPSK